MKKQAVRTVLVVAGMVVAVAGADAQQTTRGGRPSMTATGTPLPGASRADGVSGPTLGYVWDASTSNIHMVNGIAGSSLTGPGLHSASVRLAAISPNREYAVIADDQGGVWFYGEALARGVNREAVWQHESEVTHAAVSPSGDRFALYSSSAKRLAIYDVRDGATVGVNVVSGVSTSGEVVRLALGDDAQGPVAIVRAGSGADVVRFALDGGVRSFASLPNAVDLAVFGAGSRVLVLDAAQSAVYSIDLASTNPVLSLLASSSEGIEQPTALALSGDDRSVAVVSAELKRAVVVDIASRGARVLELPESPTGVRRMNARGVFQLTDARTSPMLLLEVQQDSARTVYVPRAAATRGADNGQASLR